MPGLPSLIASRDAISAESALIDFFVNPPFFFDVDYLSERYFELHHVIESCILLEDGHPVIQDLKKNWQQIDDSFKSVLDFLSPREIQEYFSNTELYFALISLIQSIRNSLHDRVIPGQKLAPDAAMPLRQSLEIIQHYLFNPVIKSRNATSEYSPPLPDEISRIMNSLFISIPDAVKSIYYVSVFVSSPFLNLKRKIPPFIRTITHLVQNSPQLFNYFIPRWGEPAIGTRSGKIALPSKKEIYFFFHDWQFILDDFDLFKDLQKMRQLKNAYYGQRLGMHITAQDLSWLI